MRGAISDSICCSGPARSAGPAKAQGERRQPRLPGRRVRQGRADRILERRRHRRRRSVRPGRGRFGLAREARDQGREWRFSTIGYKKGNWSFGWRRDHGPVTVHVSAPSLTGAEVAGSGDMKIDKIEGGDFAGEIARLRRDPARQPSRRQGQFLDRGLGRSDGGGDRRDGGVQHRRLGRHSCRRPPGEARQGVDRRLGQCRDQGDRERQCRHHGLGRRHRHRRRQVQRQQDGLGRRPLRLTRFPGRHSGESRNP